MIYQQVKLEKKDKLAEVTINRPDKLNTLNIQTVIEMINIFEDLRDDDNIRVVTLTGAGEKAFAAGADIEELKGLDMQGGKAFSERGNRMCNLIENLGKPVIAVVNGFALGGGCELAMACTLRIASEKAKMGQPEVNLGTIPGYGGTQRLSRLLPRGVAMELLITGRVIGADEALRLGLVNRVAPAGALEEEVTRMVELLLSKPPFAVKGCIEAVNRGAEVSFREGCRIEEDLFGMTCGTEDMKEGMSAFLEKRDAEFTGR
ncbi:MAG: enoyl-CoA hydratase [Candidatus Latescibacteria bacterium]|nr:enoyl-CoA hydratase [bacterium]MBD3424053.1 enoyl-CoA hydratase [Candidatus Latescibacterota bacterium]